MSANLDLVRSIFAAWGRGDFSSAQWADPEIEFASADGPDPGRWSGVASMAEVNRDFLGVWHNWRLQAEEFRELRGGSALPSSFAESGRSFIARCRRSSTLVTAWSFSPETPVSLTPESRSPTAWARFPASATARWSATVTSAKIGWRVSKPWVWIGRRCRRRT